MEAYFVAAVHIEGLTPHPNPGHLTTVLDVAPLDVARFDSGAVRASPACRGALPPRAHNPNTGRQTWASCRVRTRVITQGEPALRVSSVAHLLVPSPNPAPPRPGGPPCAKRLATLRHVDPDPSRRATPTPQRQSRRFDLGQTRCTPRSVAALLLPLRRAPDAHGHIPRHTAPLFSCGSDWPRQRRAAARLLRGGVRAAAHSSSHATPGSMLVHRICIHSQ